MADIQFEEEQQYQRPGQAEQKPFFVRLVLATGIVSTDRQAEYVLIVFAVSAIILAFFIWYLTTPSSSSGISPQDQAQVQLMKIQSMQATSKVRQ